MEEENHDIELAEEFFNHDAKNKRQVIEGFQEIIENTEDISDIHRYARKIRATREEVEAMAERAEEMINSEETGEINLQEAIQDSLDTLHSNIEYHDTSANVNWKAENYMAEIRPTVENMLYNLFDNSVEHGTDDVEIEVTDEETGLEINVYDGGDFEDWNEIFPENAEREDYPSTGSYLIDQVAENNDIEIEGSEDWSYTVKIPLNNY
ncbi:MAG: ATP-binding protein [Candidatus Nanohaloarchaea archaeon]